MLSAAVINVWLQMGLKWFVSALCTSSTIGKDSYFKLCYCCSVAKACQTLCDPMDCSMPGFPILHHLLELAPHSHWVGDAGQPSHPLMPFSPSALNLSQHQGLFQWVSSSHKMVKVLELQLQHQSFQWILRVDFLKDWVVWFPCCPRDSQESYPAPQFESINSSALSLLFMVQPSYPYMEKPQLWRYGPLSAKWCPCFVMHCLGLS